MEQNWTLVFSEYVVLKELHPIEFDTQEVAQLQNLWSNHLRGLGDIRKRLDLPDEISDVLAEINIWLTNVDSQKSSMQLRKHNMVN